MFKILRSQGDGIEVIDTIDSSDPADALWFAMVYAEVHHEREYGNRKHLGIGAYLVHGEPVGYRFITKSGTLVTYEFI